jgi:hypothetical protein
MSSPSATSSSTFTPRARWFSLLECAFGVFVVLGHNIFHILPNEVPILFVLGWLSLRWRNDGWKYAGCRLFFVSFSWRVSTKHSKFFGLFMLDRSLALRLKLRPWAASGEEAR